MPNLSRYRLKMSIMESFSTDLGNLKRFLGQKVNKESTSRIRIMAGKLTESIGLIRMNEESKNNRFNKKIEYL